MNASIDYVAIAHATRDFASAPDRPGVPTGQALTPMSFVLYAHPLGGAASRRVRRGGGVRFSTELLAEQRLRADLESGRLRLR